jgi:peroxiredoxin Q/BCP
VIEAGTPAPEFELKADDGSTVTLAGLRGRRVVLYFYPRDDTPGCTAQACGIRDQWQDFRGVDAVVLGVSPDDEASHRRFKEKYGLPFTLLSDEDHAVAERYGVWAERRMYGKTFMGIKRSTFVIGEDGTVRSAMYGVKPDTHAERVLAALAD